MLTVERLGVRYGAVQAVENVSFAVAPGEVLAVLGPNGAGKSSTLAGVSGLVRRSGGLVAVDEVVVADPLAARRRGLVHVPQGRGLFDRLTVEQNVRLGAYVPADPDPGAARAVLEARHQVPEIEPFWKRRVGTLSGGEQALVAVARLLAARPRYALLDEPALGLAPAAVEALLARIATLRHVGVGVVLVEQYVERALAVADRVITLDRGRVTYSGPPDGLGAPEDVVAAYLGANR